MSDQISSGVMYLNEVSALVRALNRAAPEKRFRRADAGDGGFVLEQYNEASGAWNLAAWPEDVQQRGTQWVDSATGKVLAP